MPLWSKASQQNPQQERLQAVLVEKPGPTRDVVGFKHPVDRVNKMNRNSAPADTVLNMQLGLALSVLPT